jgi:Icc-related predicted phosphoesterase
MKIQATADIHGSQYRLNLMLKNIERYSPDLVIVCGDITQFGPKDVARNFLDQIPVETLAITGNIDTPDVVKGIDESKATKIERKRVVRKGIPFVGISGVNPDDFKIFNDKKILDESCVLISHVPPYNTQDKVFRGIHGGSKELRKVIEEYNPRLVICGHIHEDPGFTSVNDTIVVNCSMGKKGEGAIININEKISVKMLN